MEYFKTRQKKNISRYYVSYYGTVHTAYPKLYSNGGRNGSTAAIRICGRKGLSEWVDTEGYLKEEFYQDKLSRV